MFLLFLQKRFVSKTPQLCSLQLVYCSLFGTAPVHLWNTTGYSQHCKQPHEIMACVNTLKQVMIYCEFHSVYALPIQMAHICHTGKCNCFQLHISLGSLADPLICREYSHGCLVQLLMKICSSLQVRASLVINMAINFVSSLLVLCVAKFRLCKWPEFTNSCNICRGKLQMSR